MPVYAERDPVAPTPPPVVPAPFPVRPTAPPLGPRPSNGLAVASLVSAVGGFTFVPLVGGVVATLLGALALKKEREDATRYTAGGMAVAAVVIGFFTALMPLMFVTLFTAKRITPIPFVLVAVYSGYVFHTATRGRATTGQKFAIVGGSIVTTIVAIALAIGLAFGFYFLMQAIATEIGHAIGDAFSQMFDGIGDAFDGCGDALKF
jgi:hypothetical protein